MQTNLPNFNHIKPSTIEQQLDQILQKNRNEIKQLLTQKNYNWENLITPLENIEDRLHQFWSPISHLNSVMNNPELRQAYNTCLTKLSDYATELGQNHDLYLAYQAIHQQHYATLTIAQKKVIDDSLRNFKLSGVALEGDAKQQYQSIQQQLTTLTTTFEENVLDATNAWQHHVTDPLALSGLPENAIATAKQHAQAQKLDGWLLTLQIPCYMAVMTYADSSDLRKLLYRAYVTRASELSDDGKFDNTQVMQQILTLRLKLAKLLSFKHFAEYSLATKMAQKPKEVTDFLEHLSEKTKSQAKKELIALNEFAKKEYNIDNLNAWDISYYSEKLKHQQYNISQELLRPYFPEKKVIAGMFIIIHKLYGMTVTEVTDVDIWHDDVKLYQITDENKHNRGYVYMDLYARKNKRGGAWMDECVVRRKLMTNEIQHPIAFLTCNFSAPVDNQPALLTHSEVVTLFHEFGHTLHHLLTQVDYSEISGINGVPWDAVELPSQFFENWCWNKHCIDLISSHYKTGEALPSEMLQQLLNAKNFQAALFITRQLEFALFDFELHSNVTLQQHSVQTILDAVRQKVSVLTPPDFNRFQLSFSHIFAGGYAAGYYSYLWAEVLASDAFGLFLEKGIFDHNTGRKFLHSILEQGGSQQPLVLFKKFRGREPTIDALLKQHGII